MGTPDTQYALMWAVFTAAFFTWLEPVHSFRWRLVTAVITLLVFSYGVRSFRQHREMKRELVAASSDPNNKEHYIELGAGVDRAKADKVRHMLDASIDEKILYVERPHWSTVFPPLTRVAALVAMVGVGVYLPGVVSKVFLFVVLYVTVKMFLGGGKSAKSKDDSPDKPGQAIWALFKFGAALIVPTILFLTMPPSHVKAAAVVACGVVCWYMMANWARGVIILTNWRLIYGIDRVWPLTDKNTQLHLPRVAAAADELPTWSQLTSGKKKAGWIMLDLVGVSPRTLPPVKDYIRLRQLINQRVPATR
jgi:hypothetical protein